MPTSLFHFVPLRKDIIVKSIPSQPHIEVIPERVRESVTVFFFWHHKRKSVLSSKIGLIRVIAVGVAHRNPLLATAARDRVIA